MRELSSQSQCHKLNMVNASYSLNLGDVCLAQSVPIPGGLALSSISVLILLLNHFLYPEETGREKEQEITQCDIKALVRKRGKNSKQSKGNHSPPPMGRPMPRHLLNLTNLETCSASLLLLLPQVLLLSMMLQGKEVNSCKTLILPQRMREFLSTCNH